MRIFFILFVISMTAFSCATQQSNVFSAPSLQVKGINPNTKTVSLGESKPKNQERKVSVVYVPSPTEKTTFINKGYPLFNKSKLKGSFKVSVQGIPVSNFINLVFGRVLKVNYSVSDSVKNMKVKVTFKTTESLKPRDFLETVLDILNQYGIDVRQKKGVYFISKRGRSRSETKIATAYFFGRLLPKDVPSIGVVGVFVPIYYIGANGYVPILRSLALSRNGFITKIPNRNCLLIIDSPNNIRLALRYVNMLDRPSLSNKNSVLIHFDYIQPSDFVDKLKGILPLQGIPISNSIGGPGIILKPLDSLSSLFVISPKKEWMKLIYFWKEKLDNISALGNEPRLFVYYPKNRKAGDLAKVFSRVKEIAKSNASSGFLSDVGVAVDEDGNAIIIKCKPSEYKQIRQVLERLDVLPKQVFVQVSILEVTLTGKLNYGIEWYLKHTGRYNGILQTMGGLGIGAGGLTYSVVTDTKKFSSLVDAFAKKNLINVLSSPSLIVMDNKEASINVGTQVPVITSEANSGNIQENGTTSLLRNVQYRNTGVILNIRPTINSNGVVTMDISQEVSDAQTNNLSNIDSPLILNRNIKTTVSLKSGTTLLLGGLIKKSRSITTSKVPMLGDVPLFGNLFKTTSKGNTKTELIVEVTPYILPNFSASTKVTDAYTKLMDLLR